MAKLTDTKVGSGAKGQRADGTYIAPSEADILAEQQQASPDQFITPAQKYAEYMENRKTERVAMRTVQNLPDGLYPDTELIKVALFKSKSGHWMYRLEMVLLTSRGEFNYSNVMFLNDKATYPSLEYINGGLWETELEISGRFDMRLETNFNGRQKISVDGLFLETFDPFSAFDDGLGC